jgi:hypothetical protein
VTLVDLPCGRWPQMERPADLTRIVLDALPVNGTPMVGAEPAPM